MRPITPVPRVPAEVLGVISLRGEIIQVIDLRRRLGLTPEEAGRRSRIVVLHGEDEIAAGLLVDRVTDVLRVPRSKLRESCRGESEMVAELCASEGRFVSIIDLDRVLDCDTDA